MRMPWIARRTASDMWGVFDGSAEHTPHALSREDPKIYHP